MKPARRKRWSRSPVLGENGTPITAIMNPRREQLLLYVLRNQPATIEEIHAYLGGDLKSLYYTVPVLVASNNRYLKYAEQTVRDRNLSRKDAYEIDTAGVDYLSAKGHHIPKHYFSKNFDHAKLASSVTGAIETGIKSASNARLITWGEILGSKAIPEKTRDEELAGIPTTYTDPNGEVVNKIVYADSRPFGIELTTDSRRRIRFFPGVEADMGTEPITSKNYKRTSIFAKFLAYLSIENSEAYRSHFGFPNFYVPFVTTNAARLDSIIEKLTDMGGSKMLIFQLDTDDHFNGEWRRAKHDTICLSK